MQSLFKELSIHNPGPRVGCAQYLFIFIFMFILLFTSIYIYVYLYMVFQHILEITKHLLRLISIWYVSKTVFNNNVLNTVWVYILIMCIPTQGGQHKPELNDCLIKHSLPEDLRGAEQFCGVVCCRVVTTEMCVSLSVAGPRQGALKGAAQVVERPRDDHIIVETHQRGHAQHPYADSWQRRQGVVTFYCNSQSTDRANG